MTPGTERTRGLVLGKFLPPHAGHLRLLRFAEQMVDDLDVIVASVASEPIGSELRVRWMKELIPGATVHALTDDLPSLPEQSPDFWPLWRTSLLRCLERPPTHVFASEGYGAELARQLGARFVPVTRPGTDDEGPIATSGTAIRRNPWEHWRHLPDVVRPHFLRRIAIAGPESVGKSTLAARLAKEFETVWVPEYARDWLTREGAPMDGETARVEPGDMVMIARGHAASQRALERSANRRLFVDTDALATTIWCEFLHGQVPEEVASIAEAEAPDLTLLLDVDVPFVPDPIRYLPEERRRFFDRYEAALQEAGRPFALIRGDFEERFRAAVDAVRAVPPPEPMP
ncbi:Trifunctional NAD biosynthesis/regulator protein NadR [Planctomycetes bacterium Poly30]|uniref:Trifunctional NAD biosynthesis/regulator protein NadR n=1 Tax=Saltatorellus ferox TaxID=2528018 RepID=A0A518EZD1_9BACT|nr:Trifunctional NAD biosynthesis/regulator protein NadR [Planctomycetes bacterium Poly30]